MQAESGNIGRGFWFRWVLANSAGLAIGIALFGFFEEVIGGVRGTVRSDTGIIAGVTLVGATFGLFQWLVFRQKNGNAESISLSASLTPTLVFVIVAVFTVAVIGTVAGAVGGKADENVNPAEIVRLFEALILGGAAAGISIRLMPGRQIGWAGWGILATSIGYSIGFPVGFALGGPPIDFFLGVILLGLTGGVVQWLAMRDQVNRAGWWVLASTISMAVGIAVGVVVVFTFAETIFPVSFLDTPIGFIVILSIIGAITGAVGGGISGGVLVRMLRNRTIAS